MTTVGGPVTPGRAEDWPDYLPIDGTTWMPRQAASAIQPASLVVAAVVLNLAISSPQTLPAASWARQFPVSSSVRPTDATPASRQVRVLPGTAEQLALVQHAFGLNKTQLADTCFVQRQTIYDWYAARFEAEGDNARRLADLYKVALSVRDAGHDSIPPRAVERPLDDGRCLLDLLRASPVDGALVRHAMAQLNAVAVAATGGSARAQRERLGWTALTDEQRAEQLESNLDDILGG